MRVAIVHYWFLVCGGGERVVGALAEMYPEADIHTLLYDKESIPVYLRGRTIKTSWLHHIPYARHASRELFPYYPSATESLDTSGYDLILCGDSPPMKGVKVSSDQVHICFCYVAHSRFVARRIRRFYNRESTGVFPPVNTPRQPLPEVHKDGYLHVGRLVEYKRIDILIEAVSSPASLPELMHRSLLVDPISSLHSGSPFFLAEKCPQAITPAATTAWRNTRPKASPTQSLQTIHTLRSSPYRPCRPPGVIPLSPAFTRYRLDPILGGPDTSR